MDDQYQQLPPGYGSPGETGTVLQPRQNPYQLPPTAVQQPVAQPQQPGLFDAMPYHQWLAKNVKNPWEASDDDLTGKHFSSYIDGPIKSLIKAHLANGNKNISQSSLEDRANAIADGLKIQKQSEVGANLSSLKQHLQGLAPKDAPLSTNGVSKQTVGPAGEYGEGLGYLVDNPVTRGLAEAGNSTLSAADYASNRFLGTPLKNPLTGERFTNEESQLEAPKSAGGLSRFVQGVSNVAGSVAQAGAAGGGVGTGAALLRGGAAIGVPQALNIAQAHEQETGKQESLGKLGAEAVAGTVAGMIPFGKAGAGIVRNALTGTTAGIAGDLITRAIAGDQATPEEIAKSGLTAGILSAILHLPAGQKKQLNDTINGARIEPHVGDTDALATQVNANGVPTIPINKEALAAKSAALAPEHTSKFTPQAIASDVADAESPEAAQAHFNELTKGIPPEQHQAAADAYNTVRGDIHGDEAAQVKPVQAQSATQPTEVPANQRTTDVASELPAEKAAPVEAAAAPETAPETPNSPVASTKSGVAAMLAEPVRAPILKSGKQVGSTELNFASETDKLGYLHANADAETKSLIAEQLKARGVRDPDAFSTQVQAQVKANTKSNGLKSVPARTQVGVIVPHVMQGIPLPKKGSVVKRAAPEPVLKNAPPERRAKIQRGTNGSVDVEFATPEDKELFSAIGRGRNLMQGKSGVSNPNWGRLAQLYNTDHAGAYALAKGFRDRVMNAVKGLKEGSVYKAETARPKAKPR